MSERDNWVEIKKEFLDSKYDTLVNEKKSGNLIYKKSIIENARKNATNTGWGKEIAKRILTVADYWASKTDEELVALVPTGNPRALSPGQYYGDPIDGGNRKTLYTSLETPYKWYNPNTRTWWYNGAKVKNPGTGEMVEMHDDGGGFIAPEGFPRPGEPTMFSAAYRLFIIAMLCNVPYAPVLDKEMHPESTGDKYAGAIPRLAEAFAITGDTFYVKKAAILMGRLAELYPYQNGTRGDGTHPENMHWGEISTSESIWLVNFFKAYDLIFDAVTPKMEEELTAFFDLVPDHVGEERTVKFDFKKTIDTMARHAAQSCELTRQTDSDWKLRWIETEIVISTCTGSPKLLHECLYHDQHSLIPTLLNNFYRDGRYHYDSTSYMRIILSHLITLWFPTVGFTGGDEFPEPLMLHKDKGIPLREALLLNFKLDTGAMLLSFGDTEEANNSLPIDEKRMKGIKEYESRFEIIAHYIPEVEADFINLFWDTEKMGEKQGLHEVRAEKGDFRTLAFARVMKGVYEQSGARQQIYEAVVENFIRTRCENIRDGSKRESKKLGFDEYGNEMYQEVVQERFNPSEPDKLGSELLEDSPIAYLRCGESKRTRHDLVLWGQPSAAHKHGDKLGIWFGGRGRHLAASGGNYPFTWVSPKKDNWEFHSAACWVVLVDGMTQARLSHSNLQAFYDGSLFKHASMENKIAYAPSKYIRSILLIPGPNDGDAYALDIFKVSHGYMFDYNTRGTDAGTFKDIEFNFKDGDHDWERPEGTLAGDDVPLYGCEGYGWMKDVHRTTTSSDFSFLYKYGDAGLKVHCMSFGQERSVICAMGEKGGYEMKRSPWDPHVLWREETEDYEKYKTQFVTVLESVGASSLLDEVKPIDESRSNSGWHPVGIQVTHSSGIKDVIIVNNELENDMEFKNAKGDVWATNAQVAMQRLDSMGRVLSVEFLEGTYFRTPFKEYSNRGVISGMIHEVDYQKRRVKVYVDSDDDDLYLPSSQIDGLVAIVKNPEAGRLSPYIICKPYLDDENLEFTANIPLIHATESPQTVKQDAIRGKPSIMISGKSYIVDISEGDSFRLAVPFYEG
ncbi:MAG: hypothetical protein ACFFCS_21720 [Candidatus Hodarchaeota archaeon]